MSLLQSKKSLVIVLNLIRSKSRWTLFINFQITSLNHLIRFYINSKKGIKNTALTDFYHSTEKIIFNTYTKPSLVASRSLIAHIIMVSEKQIWFIDLVHRLFFRKTPKCGHHIFTLRNRPRVCNRYRLKWWYTERLTFR